MDGNRKHPYEVESDLDEEHETAANITITQLQHLVQLLDGSDVSEIEVRRAQEGMHLVLRKAKAHNGAGDAQIVVSPAENAGSLVTAAPIEMKHTVTAPLVGIFHTWGKPKGRPLIAVGDRVKVGQRVGTIQSLNVMNEVESLVAGRVVELLVQDGQAVEYGQQLVVIDSTEEA